MPSEAVERLLARVAGPRKRGSGWVAHCPAHADYEPSLSIDEGEDGRALIHCHAGCTPDAVVASLEMTMRDLMPPPSPGAPPARGRPRLKTKRPTLHPQIGGAIAELERQFGPRSAMWMYEDKTGQPIGAVLRWDRSGSGGGGGGKVIRPIAFDPRGQGWRIEGMPCGHRGRSLYRIPDLALARGRVYVVEGEKCVEIMRSMGLIATTSPHGSSAADKTDWSPLSASNIAEVVLIPDNDHAGQQYMIDVAIRLAQLKCPSIVKRIDLPGLLEGGDVADLLEQHGGDVDTVKQIIESLADQSEPIGPKPVKSSTIAVSPSEPMHTEATDIPDWPEVRALPDDLPPVAPYRSDLLPVSLRAFVDDVAERLQCPPDFPAAATMVVLGSVIGRRCGIRPRRHDDWLVVPNLWGGVIGRPSLLKSPAIRAPLSVLHTLEADARIEFDASVREHNKQTIFADVKKKEAERQLQQAVRKGNDPAGALALLDEEDLPAPVRKRYLTNDATVEKLGELLSENPAGVMVFRDELVGWLHSLEKENQQGSRAFYLEAWDGTGRFTYDRIGRGTIEIESAIASIFGSIQPGKLAPYIQSAVDGGIGDDGLIQRFQLLVWPDAPTQWKNVDRWPDTQARRQLVELVNSMVDLDAGVVGAEVDEHDRSGVPFLRFDGHAQHVFDAWREKLELRLRSGEEHPAIESHLGKFRSLIPSLALILHLAEVGRGPIGEASLGLAIRWGDYLESHARRIYSAVTIAEVAAAKSIWRHIVKGDLSDGFDARGIYRRGWTGLRDSEVVKAALDLLVEHGQLIEQADDDRVGLPGRPPAPRYTINPHAMKSSTNPTDQTDQTTLDLK